VACFFLFQAIKCYLRALKIDPTNEGAMEKMATELCKIGKMEEAVQW
jgi:tetratricopeptide (TPR) repeat protein